MQDDNSKADENPAPENPARENAAPETPAPAAEAAASETAPAPQATPAPEAAPAQPKPKRKLTVKEIERLLAKAPLAVRIKDRIANLKKELIINEDLMLTSVFRGNIHQAYYKRWLKDANSLHKCAVKYRRRLTKLAHNQKA